MMPKVTSRPPSAAAAASRTASVVAGVDRDLVVRWQHVQQGVGAELLAGKGRCRRDGHGRVAGNRFKQHASERRAQSRCACSATMKRYSELVMTMAGA